MGIVDPVLSHSILYWVEDGAGEVAEPARRIREALRLDGLLLCMEQPEGSGLEYYTAPYEDVAARREVRYFDRGECGSGQEVEVTVDTLKDLVKGVLEASLRSYEEWLLGERAETLYYRGGVAGLLVKSKRVPLGAAVHITAPTCTSHIVRIVEQVVVEAGESSKGLLGGRWVLARAPGDDEWAEIRLAKSTAKALLLYSWRMISGSQPGAGYYPVLYPVLILVDDRGYRMGVIRQMEAIVATVGKLLHSYQLATMPPSASYKGGRRLHLLVNPIVSRTPLSLGELEAKLGDPRRAAEAIFKGSSPLKTPMLGELVEEYTYRAGGGYVFPTLQHYIYFLRSLVDAFSGVARSVVGVNPGTRARELRYDESSIRELLLRLEATVAELNRELVRIQSEVDVLDANLINYRALARRLRLQGAPQFDRVLELGMTAENVFKWAMSTIEYSIRILESYIQQLRDLEDATSRVLQKYLNILLTILAGTGIYSIVNPIVEAQVSGELGNILAPAISMLISFSLAASIGILERMERARIYRR